MRLNDTGSPDGIYAGMIIKNRYRLDERTGSTSVCGVYRGYDLLEAVPVTVKVLDPAPGELPGVRNPFLAAARRAARLDFPSLVKVYDFGMEDRAAFAVEETVEGEALEAKFAGGRRMNVRGFLSFAYQLTEAVDRLHSAGGVHGDIRPENVFVLPASRIKLANAGYPYYGPAGGEVAVPFPKDANREADLRSLGFLFYRCLTGRDLDPALLEDGPPTPRLDLGEEVPSKVVQIVEKALSRGEKSRFAGAGELLKELGVALQREDPMAALPSAAPAPEDEPPPPPGLLRRFSRTQVLAGTAVLAVLAVALMIMLFGLLGPKNRVTAPNLVDVNVEEARKKAESEGLKLVVAREEHRSDVKAGRVFSQKPPAGKRINEGDTISVTVSLGPLQVPNLSLLPVDDAAALLRSRGLAVGEVYYQPSSESRPGLVLESDPPFGTEVSGGDRVDLVVSKAP